MGWSGMSEFRLQKDQYRHDKIRIRDSQPPLDKQFVAERIASRARELGLKQSDIASAIGIPKTTMGRIWKGENLPDSAALFPLSDLLQVSPRWLLYGGNSRNLVDAPDMDWATLPVHDLAGITGSEKGTAIDTMPIRRDWIERKLRAADDLWLTEMPDDLLGDIAGEGDILICRDIEPRESELIDGSVYIVMLNGQPIIRRITFEAHAILLSTSSGRVPPIRVPRAEPPALDRSIRPIARVLGALTLMAL
ncbi:MAG: S24 family peptidase [Parasphingopyxis sp.]|uniref:S24 family peptidase n=1 Tax=Parasphingopyxis sp. TaxID=1920299 RepID=UPI003F9EF1B4